MAILYVNSRNAWLHSPKVWICAGFTILACGLLLVLWADDEATPGSPAGRVAAHATGTWPAVSAASEAAGETSMLRAPVGTSARPVDGKYSLQGVGAASGLEPARYAGIETLEQLEAQLNTDAPYIDRTLLMLVRRARAGDAPSKVDLATKLLECSRRGRSGDPYEGPPAGVDESLPPGAMDPCPLMSEAVLQQSLPLLESAMAQGSSAARVAYGELAVEAALVIGRTDATEDPAAREARFQRVSALAVQALKEALAAGEPRALLSLGSTLARLPRPGADDGSWRDVPLEIEYAFALAAAQTGKVPQAQASVDHLTTVFEDSQSLAAARQLAAVITDQWQRGQVPELPSEYQP